MNDLTIKAFHKKETLHHDKKDAHTGKRSEHKPKTYEEGNVIREVKDKHRDRVNRAYTRSRKICEKNRIKNQLKMELYDNYDYNNDISNNESSNVEHFQNAVKNDQSPVEFAEKIGLTIMNLFINGDVKAAIEDLKELYVPKYKGLIVYIVVEKSLNYKNKHRELISQYLARISMAEILDEFDFRNGFDLLLDDLDDLEIDFPEVKTHLATFLARATSDECLPPIYIKQRLAATVDKINIRQCLKHAKFLYRHISRYIDIDQIWGEEATVSGIEDLVRTVVNMINRYIEDEDLNKFFKSVMELDVPHFHHAIIREIITLLVMENSSIVFDKILKLMKHIIDTALMTDEQIQQGFLSACDDIKNFDNDHRNSHIFITNLAKKLEDMLPEGLSNLVINKLQ